MRVPKRLVPNPSTSVKLHADFKVTSLQEPSSGEGTSGYLISPHAASDGSSEAVWRWMIKRLAMRSPRLIGMSDVDVPSLVSLMWYLVDSSMTAHVPAVTAPGMSRLKLASTLTTTWVWPPPASEKVAVPNTPLLPEAAMATIVTGDPTTALD